MKKRKVIDDGGNEYVLLIPENDQDQQVAQGHTIGGIGDPNKKAKRRKNYKIQKKQGK